jgi:LmbE family N-acetylglucosaminyl deacetylase
MSQQRYLFLSPHLDDVVLSCALRIIKERREGADIQVATIFTKAMSILPGLDLYNGRHSEDKKALSILGISKYKQLNFCDAPFRNLYYTSFSRIVLDRHAKDDFYEKEVAKQIDLLYKEYAPQTIFIPLAIGTHIDHRLTHNIWCSLPPDVNIIFYEDRPYVLLPHSLNLRLAEISAMHPALQTYGNNDVLKDFADGLKKITLYKSVLTRTKERFRYLLWAARNLKLENQEPRVKLEPELITTNSADDLSLIEKAIFAYKSQINMLYKNTNTFEEESAVYNQSLHTSSIYAERYWKLVR